VTKRGLLETDPKRSALMARVRQRHTDAELIVGKTLRHLGISYRLNVRSLPGTPDFANRQRKWAILVNGCYWHHHTGCKRATVPTRNREFWLAKFETNRSRDAEVIRLLRQMGFRVLIVWECETASPEFLACRLSALVKKP
jgi:DNA mismatch endonuclease (patch repair protein)